MKLKTTYEQNIKMTRKKTDKVNFIIKRWKFLQNVVMNLGLKTTKVFVNFNKQK